MIQILPEFGYSPRILYSIFPSQTVSHIVTEVYNSAHALSHFISSYGLVVVPIQNDCLFKLNDEYNTQTYLNPGFLVENKIISKCISQIT